MKTVTVNQLKVMVDNLVRGGKGEKKIMITSDDEGNEYHELFFGFTEDVENVFSDQYSPFLPAGVTREQLKDYIILG